MHTLAFDYMGVADYEPGAFYKRELPCILTLLHMLDIVNNPYNIECIFVDSFVDLHDHAGLGRHLYTDLYVALGRETQVIGVAKTAFQGAQAVEVVRGVSSKKPLYVQAAGMLNLEAAEMVKSLDGENRIPTMLKLVDTLARTVS